jgi:hypothetical protein
VLNGLAALGHVASFSIEAADAGREGIIETLSRLCGRFVVDAVLGAFPPPLQPEPAFLMAGLALQSQASWEAGFDRAPPEPRS